MGAKNIWSIGRDTECDIVLNSKNVSRKQAEIVFQENVYYLVNHSKHKTSFVERGGQKLQVEKQKLAEGDLLYFADEGPYQVKELVDGEMTVINLDSHQTVTPHPQHQKHQNVIDMNAKIEMKRCVCCATIFAKDTN